MLFLLRFSNSTTSPIETYSILDRNNQPYSIIHSSYDFPYDIIDTTFDAIDFLLSKAGLLTRVSLFIGNNKEIHQHYFKYNIESQNSFINSLKEIINKESFEFFEEKIKIGRFLMVYFYKNKCKKEFGELIKEFNYLLEDHDVNSKGLALEINIFGEETLVSILYKETLRKTLYKFDVKRLDFIGRTSMKVENSILISSLSNIEKNKIVYDPFCGTGSLLNIPAYFGCKVIGSDLNRKEFFGRNKLKGKIRTSLLGFNVFSNFKKFNLLGNVISFIACDINDSPITYADSIITDIPYGVRISAKNEAMFFIDSLFKLGQRILPNDGILSFFAPSFEIGHREDFKCINKIEEKTGTVLRSLYVYQKIN